MVKRFALVIGVAALGAALIAVGASADFRSVDDPRGDARCSRGSCSDSKMRNADIVRATAGHGGGRLKHTIRVVGRFQSGYLTINTGSDRSCEYFLAPRRGRGRSKVRQCDASDPGPVRTGRARMDFHPHSVEIFFRKRAIGNPQGYGWAVATSVGGKHAAQAGDFVPNRRPGNSHHGPRWPGYIQHRFGVAAPGVMALGAQPTAAVPALASQTVKIDSRVTLPRPQKNPFYGRVKSSKHACKVHRLVKVYRVMPGRDHVADSGDAKDRTNRRGKWRAGQAILIEGNYYAKVVRRKEGTAGTTFVCRQDRSPTRHVQSQR